MPSRQPLRFRNAWEIWLYAVPTLLLLLIWGCGKSNDAKTESAKSESTAGTPKKSGGGLMSALFGGNQKANSKNNLKQLGLALHNYHDTYNTFPPGGIYDKQMKGHHSWQTSLLPFVEQQPLFSRIDTNQPWDTPKNRPLFENEVPNYLVAGSGLATRNSDGLALSHYSGNKNIFYPNSRMAIRDFRDGMTNTMMAGEVTGGLKPWGDPTNYRDLAKGLGNGPEIFGGVHGDRTLILLGDGSVRELKLDTDPQILKALSTPAGGERQSGF